MTKQVTCAVLFIVFLSISACGPLAQPAQTPIIIYVTVPPAATLGSGEGGVSTGIKTPTSQPADTPTTAATVAPTTAASATSAPSPTRTPIVRQSTPPSVISLATATQAAPAPPTPTTPPPAPTDTPIPAPPPPTNTPRPPAAAFRMDVRVHEGYERWGTPVNGCQDFDNTRPEKKLTMDVVVYNDTTRVVSPNDIDVTYLDSGGQELVYCVYTDQNGNLPNVPPRGSATYVLAAFVAQDGWVSQMRVTIGTTTLRRCFAPNNRADLVGCG